MFEAQWTQANRRASLRIGKRTIIKRCVCGRVGTQRMETDEGSYNAITASVKVQSADWVTAGSPVDGSDIEFGWYDSNVWKTYRISESSETDGLVSVDLEAENA